MLGKVYCLDAGSGREYWDEPTGALIFGSPLIVDGKIFVANDAGDVFIFALAKEKKLLAKIDMPTTIFCSPVFAHGVLYLVSEDEADSMRSPGTGKPGGQAGRQKGPPAHFDAIFVPTPQDVVEKMLELAKVKKTDLVYDLGCGDGRIVVTAAKKFGSKAVGFDLDPRCVELARASVQKENVGALVRIEQKDVFTLDLSQADVVTLYLGERLNAKLLPQLQKLKPGARIVSHHFHIEGRPPSRVCTSMSGEDGIEHTLYLWTAPLKKE